MDGVRDAYNDVSCYDVSCLIKGAEAQTILINGQNMYIHVESEILMSWK